jgi:peptidoglycan/xylan/chitin deacetylase (PgdA/CDA1 family)
MARKYVIQKGDTLSKIAKNFYGDLGLYQRLAKYNGIRNPNLIRVGQTIEIPSKRELEGKNIKRALRYGQNTELRRDEYRDIVLTFDDGPRPNTTTRLLDFLDENSISAVFFVVGQNIDSPKGRDLVERMSETGHIIGNHTYSHPNLRKLQRSQIEEEISRTHELICEITGRCELFRPPYGASNGIVGDVLHTLGYQQLLWNVDTMDWKYRQEGKWVDHGMEQIKARQDCIVLMHDIHKTTVDNVRKLVNRINRIEHTRFVLY